MFGVLRRQTRLFRLRQHGSGSAEHSHAAGRASGPALAGCAILGGVWPADETIALPARLRSRGGHPGSVRPEQCTLLTQLPSMPIARQFSLGTRHDRTSQASSRRGRRATHAAVDAASRRRHVMRPGRHSQPMAGGVVRNLRAVTGSAFRPPRPTSYRHRVPLGTPHPDHGCRRQAYDRTGEQQHEIGATETLVRRGRTVYSDGCARQPVVHCTTPQLVSMGLN